MNQSSCEIKKPFIIQGRNMRTCELDWHQADSVSNFSDFARSKLWFVLNVNTTQSVPPLFNFILNGIYLFNLEWKCLFKRFCGNTSRSSTNFTIMSLKLDAYITLMCVCFYMRVLYVCTHTLKSARPSASVDAPSHSHLWKFWSVLPANWIWHLKAKTASALGSRK